MPSSEKKDINVHSEHKSKLIMATCNQKYVSCTSIYMYTVFCCESRLKRTDRSICLFGKVKNTLLFYFLDLVNSQYIICSRSRSKCILYFGVTLG